MRYAFDPAKQATNVVKHGVSFEAACDFEWQSAWVQVDARKGYGETRFTALGLIGERVHVMVFTLRETSVRIISLRRANRREVSRYAERTQEHPQAAHADTGRGTGHSARHRRGP
ncbi:MAG: BrnT family toxin [Comamonas sp.]